MSLHLSNHVLKEIYLKNGQKLVLGKPSAEDAKKMIEYFNIVGGESDNLLFGAGEFKLTIDQEINHINSINSDENSLIILGVIDENIVSVAQIISSKRKRIAHNSEMSISVKKDYWGTGIGTAMMNEIVRFAKSNNTIRNITLGVNAGNTRAIKLYEKFGFEIIGVHKNNFNVNGIYDDEILMDLNIY
ncbi:GNAT family N-acetyltransferase [Alkaliphilus sp. B6464]|uniref:GNAT family N-acetyltransferase n=1 Tax=Alkaliphilus sp. B6464 TaxID=2731219 RepID=UPI001BA4BD22|nr:GNAT family N-acetyltransferase [Alkaliphilus sp. B6464]QUH19523.1 GNAT family N-acetyltransferase [Alkaliphilus sp. B6464]